MRLSKDFFYTIREDVSNEDSKSGSLLVRSGMIKKVANGIYLKTPIGLRVAKKVEDIIRKNMNEAGGAELSMPLLLPMDVFEKAGRKDTFGNMMFSLNDRYSREFALGPTHEEMFVIASMEKVRSYKDLPYTIYQIGNKYRDEIRPRLGLIRTREFTMKDAYSFDIDTEGLELSYNKMFEAYHKIFKEIGLEYVVVRAATGVMGGLLSEEFQALSNTGEDILVLCVECDYSSNIEVSKCVERETKETEEEQKLEEIHTPNAGTIEDVTNYLGLPVEKFVKTLIYKADEKFYACIIEADREVNVAKVAQLLGANEIGLAEAEDVIKVTKAEVGFAGPIGIDIPVIMDANIKYKKNFIIGANKTDYHIKNVNIKDFKQDIVADIIEVKEGDICPNCGKHLIFKKGIEVGNTFKLGTKYSEKLGLNYLGNDNKQYPVVMGCYGIGVERIIATVVEQNNDEKGIIWPLNIAPYKVGIVLINGKDEKQKQTAENLYNELNNLGIDTLLDDRDERAGVKFNDIDLIGIPIRITIGKKIEDNLLELKLRKEDISNDYNLNDIIEVITRMCS